MSSSASGSASSAAHRRRGVAAERRRGRVALERDDRVEHLERVAVDVEVVVDALLDPAQRVELGQHHVEQPESRPSAAARARAAAAATALELGEHALGATPRQRGACRAPPRAVAGSTSKPSSTAKRASAQGRSGSSARAAR